MRSTDDVIDEVITLDGGNLPNPNAKQAATVREQTTLARISCLSPVRH